MKAILKPEFQFRKISTRYATHGIHPYVAAMVPALAQRLIKDTRPKKLLDPFCGGGTVCVEGVLAGVETTGLDVNFLSNLITSAKTTWVDKHLINKKLLNIKKNMRSNLQTGHDKNERKKYLIDYWFKPDTIKELTKLSKIIKNMRNTTLKTIFQCLLSGTARDCSLTYKNEVRLHRLRPKDMNLFNPCVMDIFEKRAINAISAISDLPENTLAGIHHGSVLDMPFKNNQFDTIICSPPYGDERNGVPYTQFSKNMLYWLGVSKELLAKNKKHVLGHVCKDEKKQIPDSNTLKATYKNMDNDINKAELVSFYHDYDLALKEMARVTSDTIVIVIGDRVLNNHVIYNAKITTDLITNHGLKLTKHYLRDLPSKRIPKFGKAKHVNGGCIDREDILFYEFVR